MVLKSETKQIISLVPSLALQSPPPTPPPATYQTCFLCRWPTRTEGRRATWAGRPVSWRRPWRGRRRGSSARPSWRTGRRWTCCWPAPWVRGGRGGRHAVMVVAVEVAIWEPARMLMLIVRMIEGPSQANRYFNVYCLAKVVSLLLILLYRCNLSFKKKSVGMRKPWKKRGYI